MIFCSVGPPGNFVSRRVRIQKSAPGGRRVFVQKFAPEERHICPKAPVGHHVIFFLFVVFRSPRTHFDEKVCESDFRSTFSLSENQLSWKVFGPLTKRLRFGEISNHLSSWKSGLSFSPPRPSFLCFCGLCLPAGANAASSLTRTFLPARTTLC